VAQGFRRFEQAVLPWFVGGEVNTCYNALDRHIENGRADQVALIYDSPVTDTIQSFTFRELREQVAKCAGALAELGLSKGDRVIVYMPMIPEAVIAMLAVARLGAIHSVVFGGFASQELAVRIDHARRLVISASVASSRADRGRRSTPPSRGQPQASIIVYRARSNVRNWQGRPDGTIMAGDAAWLRAGRCDRPALHPVHLGHDRPTEGHRA
jgi:acyl-coenzyme A synthetase/AMP-(fatty) acid ligase